MLAGLVLLATSAHGQTVSFDFNTDEARSRGIDPDAMQRDISTSVEKDLGLIDLTDYLHRFARAAAIASKGMGVDYASHPKVFSAGITLGTAVSGTRMSFDRGEDVPPEGGFAFQASIQAGLNLGALDPKHNNLLDHFRLYVSGLGLRAPSEDALGAKLYNFGVHGQVVILRPRAWGAAEWGGLELTTGYERLEYLLTLQNELPLTYRIQSFLTTWRANGDYGIATHVDSIPVELSTSGRAGFLTLFGGLGLDFDIAGSTASGALAGPVLVVFQRDVTEVGNGSVALDGTGDANGGQFRGFLGFQLNVWSFKVYTHLNVGVDQTYGAFAGVRVAK